MVRKERGVGDWSKGQQVSAIVSDWPVEEHIITALDAFDSLLVHYV